MSKIQKMRECQNSEKSQKVKKEVKNSEKNKK